MDLSQDYACDDCNQPCRYEFIADHGLWNHVIHGVDSTICDELWSETSKYLCLNCFAKRARELEIEEFPVTIVGNWDTTE